MAEQSTGHGAATPDVPPTPISLSGAVFLGAYLVTLATILMLAVWSTIPPCDVTTVVVDSLSPAQVLTKGGDRLRIVGEGFREGATVQIGDNSGSRATFISPFELVVSVPSVQAPGRVPVRIAQNGGPAIEVAGGVEYVTALPSPVVPSRPLTTPPASTASGDAEQAAAVPATEMPVALDVAAMTPATGSVNGGDVVTFRGSGFTSATRVFFGGIPGRSVRVDGTHFLVAVTPSHAAGPVSVLVGTDRSSAVAPEQFSYVCPAPPDRTMVLLVLLAGALGGVVHALRSFYWYVGEGKLLWNWVGMYVVLPWSSAALGFVFFLVIRAGLYDPSAGTSYLLVGLAALVGMFSSQAAEKLKAIAEGLFAKAPQGTNSAPPSSNDTPLSPTATITSVSPASGPTFGGTVVTILGSGFVAPSTVRFGNTLSPQVTDVDSNTLRAIAPPASVIGSVEIGVAPAQRTEVVKANAYAYRTPKGGILDVAPAQGPVAGGTPVRITGTQLGGGVSVTFGDRRAAAPTVVAEGTIEVSTPSQGQPGPVDVRIDAGDDLIAVAVGGFTYKP